MKKIKKILGKLRSFLLMSWYTLFYYKFSVQEKWVLIDSKNGKDLGSNLLQIAREIAGNPAYKSYRVYISCNKDKKADIKDTLSTCGISGVRLIRENRLSYCRVLARAGYLFTDTTFPFWFTKREGQVMTNTWHGTPLKMMGKDVDNRAYDMGNVQRNHFIADYLLYPSDYMKDIMVSAYFLNNLYQGKILCSGYPRNSVFFDVERSRELRKTLDLEDKKLYGYMPTWRGNLKNIDSEKITNMLEYYFIQLDKSLKEDEIFLVRLHPFVSNSIDYSNYKHIKPFPQGYDAYDILNICDCLVTDYSSVFFDYANTGRKIILFVYDKELYMDERGVYVSINSFPFPQVRTVEELVGELRRPKDYDDSRFRERFCKYDGENVAEKVCRHIILGEKVFREEKAESNGRENVVLYTGALAKNGITTALLSLLANIDTSKRNYYVSFRSSLLKDDPLRVGLLPKDVGFIPIPSLQGKSLGEGLCAIKYFEKKSDKPGVVRKLDRCFKRMYKRAFGYCNLDCVIQYQGYDRNITNMFLHSPVTKMIYVHNDMVAEIKTRQNQHEATVRRAYSEYDRVVPVTEDIYPPTLELGGNEDIIRVANNCHDYETVKEKARRPLMFDPDTLCNVSCSELGEILESDSLKFITIGRFSPEKGHEMLIRAFDQYYKKNPDSYLIIIGGHGGLYDRTAALAKSLPSAKHIILIRSISNPMPVLQKSNLFILSSLYEGLGLVLLEADTLGVPVMSTDIVGPKRFMEAYGGHLVPPTQEGIYQGILDFEAGKIKAIGVDYEKYNQKAVAQFEKLFEGEA